MFFPCSHNESQTRIKEGFTVLFSSQKDNTQGAIWVSNYHFERRDWGEFQDSPARPAGKSYHNRYGNHLDYRRDFRWLSSLDRRKLPSPLCDTNVSYAKQAIRSTKRGNCLKRKKRFRIAFMINVKRQIQVDYFLN